MTFNRLALQPSSKQRSLQLTRQSLLQRLSPVVLCIAKHSSPKEIRLEAGALVETEGALFLDVVLHALHGITIRNELSIDIVSDLLCPLRHLRLEVCMRFVHDLLCVLLDFLLKGLI